MHENVLSACISLAICMLEGVAAISDNPDRGPGIYVDYSFPPNWVVSGRAVKALCVAHWSNDPGNKTGSDTTEGVMRWTLRYGGKTYNWTMEPVSDTVELPKYDHKSELMDRKSEELPDENGLKRRRIQSRLIATVVSGKNVTLTCAVGALKGGIIEQAEVFQEVIKIYHPASQPDLTVYAPVPSGGVYLRSQFNVSCNARVGSVGNLTWTLSDTETGGLTTWTVSRHGDVDVGNITGGVADVRQLATFDQQYGPDVRSTFSIHAKKSLNSAEITCSTENPPELAKLDYKPLPVVYKATKPLRIVFAPQRPRIMNTKLAPTFKELTKTYRLASCEAFPGTDGNMTFTLKSRVGVISMEVDKLGQSTMVNKTDKFSVKTSSRAGADDLDYGPFLTANMTYEPSKIPSDLVFECEVTPSPHYTAIDKRRFVSTRMTAMESKPMESGRLSSWTVVPVSVFAMVLTAMSVSTLKRADGNINLSQRDPAARHFNTGSPKFPNLPNSGDPAMTNEKFGATTHSSEDESYSKSNSAS